MEILEIIDRFIKDQRYVKDWLVKFMGMKENMTWWDWVENDDNLLKLNAKIPLAQEFSPHGCGLHFRDEKVNIDFDFSRSGRDGGFDAWRLYVYCKLNNIQSIHKTHQDFMNALDVLQSANVIEQVDELYFLRKQ